MNIYHLAFKKDVSVTCWPDPKYVLCCEKDYRSMSDPGTYDGHRGLDCSTGQWGSPLFAMHDGIVVELAEDNGREERLGKQYCWTNTSGHSIAIRSPKGIVSAYKHLADSPFKTLTLGQNIKKGDPIGRMGNTGNSTGAHLHVDVLADDAYYDPTPYVQGIKSFGDDAPSQPQDTFDYVFQKGDTLWSLAARYLNGGNQWTILADLNRISNPENIQIGTIIKIPGNKSADETIHTIIKGETLWGLAVQYLGNGSRWPEIVRLNPGMNPDNLQIGMAVKIPAK